MPNRSRTVVAGALILAGLATSGLPLPATDAAQPMGAGPLSPFPSTAGRTPASDVAAGPAVFRSAGATATPATGSDRRINDPAQDQLGPTCTTQSEVSLARSGETLVAGWNDGGRCDLIAHHAVLGPSVGLSLSGYAWSHDGGATWSDGGVLAPPEGWSFVGDPTLAAGTAEGEFYYATLADVPKPPPPDDPLDTHDRVVAVLRSLDGGATWGPPLVASGPRDAEACQDKPWLAVDRTASPDAGSVYVAWTELVSCGQGGAMRVLFARARPAHGAPLSFQAPVKLSTEVEIVDGEFPGLGTQVAVGPKGEVYVVWADIVASTVLFTASFDGGRTFAAPRFAVSPYAIGRLQPTCSPTAVTRTLRGDIRVMNWPSIAVDTAGSDDPAAPDFNPFHGRVYLAVPAGDGTTTNDADIAFVYSADRGQRWVGVEQSTTVYRPTVRVNDDDEQGATDQFHPQVAVDDVGNVAVTWYDRRADPNNRDLEVYAAVSTDGGETFSPNVRVSDVAFPPARTNPNTNLMSGCYMGEYNGLVATGPGTFLAAWGDTREGPRELPDPNVYADAILLPAAEPPPGLACGGRGQAGNCTACCPVIVPVEPDHPRGGPGDRARRSGG